MCTTAYCIVYYLSIDADAIVLDFSLRVEDVFSQLSPSSSPSQGEEVDLLASADVRMGLINTGVLMARNTPWVRDFLARWWYGHEHGYRSGTVTAQRAQQTGLQWRSVCDQEAFDRLYAWYIQQQGDTSVAANLIAQKVRVLPMHALNSHPPAMLHQQATHRVLHLMGEASALRREVFRTAWSSVCAARSGGVLPPQLGVHREVLLNTARLITLSFVYGYALKLIKAWPLFGVCLLCAFFFSSMKQTI